MCPSSLPVFLTLVQHMPHILGSLLSSMRKILYWKHCPDMFICTNQVCLCITATAVDDDNMNYCRIQVLSENNIHTDKSGEKAVLFHRYVLKSVTTFI